MTMQTTRAQYMPRNAGESMELASWSIAVAIVTAGKTTLHHTNE